MINIVGPRININNNRDIANTILIWESFLIPESKPNETLTRPIAVMKAIMISWFMKFSFISNTWFKPALIWTVPNPREVVTPNTVVSMAITSIVIARFLFEATFDPKRELTLKGRFLLYEAKAKHNPNDD